MGRSDVVVVGAGLAGLVTARTLQRWGIEVSLVEAADGVGGRMRTDHLDGMLLDRGFQVLNPAYPRLGDDIDLAALDLCSFEAGVVVAQGSRRRIVADPRRVPREAIHTMTVPWGTLREKLALLRWAARIGYGPARWIKDRDDAPLADELRRRGIRGELLESVLRPFLAGVLADDELRTSRRLVELIVRSFLRGIPGVPRAGMQAIPDQVAATLAHGTVALNTAVSRLAGTTVHTDAGTVSARAVVIAADPPGAAALLGLRPPTMRPLTTFYHCAERSPVQRGMLHLDGDRRGPVVNTAVMTDVAPSYAPGGALIASTVLGADDSAAAEGEVRQQLAAIYGADTRRWRHVATYAVRDALPDMPPGTPLQKPVALGDGLFVAGDHRDTPSIQGTLVSAHRAATAVAAHLGVRSGAADL